MKILSIEEPFMQIPFLNAGRGPGQFYVDSLPVHRGKVDELPEGVSALVVTADLQGRQLFQEANGPIKLLGEVLPDRLAGEILPDMNLPTGRICVILAGDFYTVPALDKRGGTGDVTKVWEAFAYRFDWVVGVAGNHDQFGELEKPDRLPDNAHFLDQDHQELDSLILSGVSGIIGNPKRHWRRTADQYGEAILQAVTPSTDVLVLHDGPDAPGVGKGSPVVREMLNQLPPMLIVRGHAHWKKPLSELENGAQVLNVDARVVVLTA